MLVCYNKYRFFCSSIWPIWSEMLLSWYRIGLMKSAVTDVSVSFNFLNLVPLGTLLKKSNRFWSLICCPSNSIVLKSKQAAGWCGVSNFDNVFPSSSVSRSLQLVIVKHCNLGWVWQKLSNSWWVTASIWINFIDLSFLGGRVMNADASSGVVFSVTCWSCARPEKSQSSMNG